MDKINTDEGSSVECPNDLSNYEVAKNLIRSLVSMKLDYEHAKYAVQIMK